MHGVGPVPSNGDVGSKRAYGALVLAGVIALVMMGISGAWVIGCAAGIAVAATALARWKIGGTRATPWGQHRCWAKHSHCWLPFNF